VRRFVVNARVEVVRHEVWDAEQQNTQRTAYSAKATAIAIWQARLSQVDRMASISMTLPDQQRGSRCEILRHKSDDLTYGRLMMFWW
jgi:hypothetical protein